MLFSNFLIASDLDGTFLNKGGTVVPRNLDAIAHFTAHGGHFTLNTGRPHITIPPTVPQFEQILNAPCAHCNGAYLYNFQTKEFLLEELMPPKDAADILHFALTHTTPDLAFRANAREQIRVFVPEGGKRPRVIGEDRGIVTFDLPVEKWPMDDWYKLVFIGDPARIQAVRRDFAAAFGNRFAMTTSSAHALEVQLPGASKAVGLQKMRRLSPEMSARTVIACGDFENDIPMLRAADIAICPANAMDEVKAVCDLVLCECGDGLIGDVVDAIVAGKIRPKQK